ncbi:MAG TPA: hypothetical protein VFH74_07070 [Gaiellales bacterium]|nr:hypothetical protein [Gaiellales bacterium]
MAADPQRPPLHRHAARAGAALAALAVAVLAIRALAAIAPPGVALLPAFLLVLLVPGLATARMLRLDDALDPLLLGVGAIPLGCAAWCLALMVALVLQLPLAVLAAAVGAAAAVILSIRPVGSRLGGSRWTLPAVAGGGLALAVAASRYETAVLHGDGLFHAGRVRKLIDLPHLSLSGLSSVWHGSPHAGYVVPALHAMEAVAVRITGTEPSAAYSSLAPACAFLLPAAAFGLGSVAAGRAAGTAVAVLAAWDSLARESLSTMQQPPTFTFFVLVPATLALLLAASRSQWDRRMGRAVMLAVFSVAVIHATYAVLPLACMVAVVIVSRAGLRALAACIAVTGVVYGVIWAVALRGGTPQPQPAQPAGVFVERHGHPIVAEASWIFDGRPEIVLGVLAVVPLLLLYRGRHAVAASVMAGALALCSFPGIPALLTGVFGIGQVKRFGRGGLPWALTAAIALVELAAVAGRRAALAAAAGIALASLLYQAVVPEGWLLTALVTILTVAGAVIVIVYAVRARPLRLNVVAGAGTGTAVVFALALTAGSVRAEHSQVWHDLRHGVTVTDTLPRVPDSVVAYMREHDQAPFPVVLAEAYIGYQLAGEADVYPVALPLERTRGEPRNSPGARRRAVNIALAPGGSAQLRARIFDRYDVRYVVVNSDTTPRAQAALAGDPRVHPVLRTGPWTVYRVGRS